MRFAIALILCSCANDLRDRHDLARAELAEAYVRQLCPAIELDGGAF